MPYIEHIRATPYDIPLKSSLAWGANHKLEKLNHVLIEVTLSDGAHGYAESTPRPMIYGETQASVIAIIQQYLAPLCLNVTIQSKADIDALDIQLAQIKHNQTARGALNMALYMAFAQSSELTLGELLGITQERTRLSYIVGIGTSETVIADVESAYKAGVRVFKMKIGKNPADEMQTIANLQAQFHTAQFYVDANECLTLENAPKLLNQLHDMGVLYCEEALPIHQVLERSTLRQKTPMPIIGDDSCFSVYDVQRELALDTLDIVNIKTPRTGFSHSEVIRTLLENKKGMMIGSQASSLLGCLHSATFALCPHIYHATEASFFIKTDNFLNDIAPPIHDGYWYWHDIANSLSNEMRLTHQ